MLLASPLLFSLWGFEVKRQPLRCKPQEITHWWYKQKVSAEVQARTQLSSKEIHQLQSLSKHSSQTGFTMFYMDLSQIFTLSTSQKDDLSQCNKLSNNNKNYLISRKNGGGAERVWGGMISLLGTLTEPEHLGMRWPTIEFIPHYRSNFNKSFRMILWLSMKSELYCLLVKVL